MGAGASAGIGAAVQTASSEDIAAVIRDLPAAQRDRLDAAIIGLAEVSGHDTERAETDTQALGTVTVDVNELSGKNLAVLEMMHMATGAEVKVALTGCLPPNSSLQLLTTDGQVLGDAQTIPMTNSGHVVMQAVVELQRPTEVVGVPVQKWFGRAMVLWSDLGGGGHGGWKYKGLDLVDVFSPALDVSEREAMFSPPSKYFGPRIIPMKFAEAILKRLPPCLGLVSGCHEFSTADERRSQEEDGPEEMETKYNVTKFSCAHCGTKALLQIAGGNVTGSSSSHFHLLAEPWVSMDETSFKQLAGNK